MGERRGPAGDAGLGAHPLAGLQRVLEQGGKDRTADALLPGVLEGPPDLPDHLALAQHGGLEPGGDREEVGGDVVVEADGGPRRQLVGGHAGVLGEHLVDLGHRIVEAVDDRVDLGAQAGREDHGLLQVAAVAQRRQHLVQVSVADRHRLEKREGGLLVLEPYDDDGHADASSVGSPACRSLGARCQSPRSGPVGGAEGRSTGTAPSLSARAGSSWRAR